MSIQVNCEGCTRSFKVKDRYAGREGICPYCAATVIVPLVPELASAVTTGDPTPMVIQYTLKGSESVSSLSLVTKIPKMPCPNCGKPNLVGNPSCYFCDASLLGSNSLT